VGRAVSSRVASALVVTGLLLVPAPNAAAADPFAIRVQREIYAVVPFQRQVFFLGDKGRAPLLLYGEGQSPIVPTVLLLTDRPARAGRLSMRAFASAAVFGHIRAGGET